MLLQNGPLKIALSPSGNIEQLIFGRVDFIDKVESNTLFLLQLRNDRGEIVDVDNREFGSVQEFGEIRGGQQFEFILFSGCAKVPGLRAVVRIRQSPGEPMSYWHIRLEGIPGGYYCEWLQFPCLHLKNLLKGHGGDAEFFWPGSEGVIFTELTTRQSGNFATSLLEYPLTGIGGYYPGPCPMQFQAYLTPRGSLYLACHDLTHSPKGIDVCYGKNNSLKPYFQLFPGKSATCTVDLDFEIVLGGFYGDWQDACRIYRDWMEQNDAALPLKLINNHDVPDWLKNSPVLLIYPVKGNGFDTGSLTGNEYFPYHRALPMVEDYARRWDSQIMPLLMHWEGTAPWAPPYVWPPFGGEEMLRSFADELHQRGHLLGVYCSGTGWTQSSSIDPGYSRKEEFAEKNLKEYMCTGPRGEMFARVCNGEAGKGQRIGYEMCTAVQWTQNTVLSEINAIAGANVDYLQFFDQNQGCSAPLCYSHNHHHPASPGRWLTEAMQSLLDRAAQQLRNGQSRAVLGCENGAAQPYIRNLQLNDLRNHLAWNYAKPVPAYSMVFHEYLNSFTGNGVCLAGWIDRQKSPDFILYRMAYSFISGEILSLVMKNDGQMHWSWVCDWADEAPDQAALNQLIKNLNGWRRQRGKDFLVFGKMEKSFAVDSGEWVLHFTGGRPPLTLPELITSHWSFDGRSAVFIANIKKQKAYGTISFDQTKTGKYYNNPNNNSKGTAFKTKQLCFEIAALSALMIEFESPAKCVTRDCSFFNQTSNPKCGPKTRRKNETENSVR